MKYRYINFEKSITWLLKCSNQYNLNIIIANLLCITPKIMRLLFKWNEFFFIILPNSKFQLHTCWLKKKFWISVMAIIYSLLTFCAAAQSLYNFSSFYDTVTSLPKYYFGSIAFGATLFMCSCFLSNDIFLFRRCMCKSIPTANGKQLELVRLLKSSHCYAVIF